MRRMTTLLATTLLAVGLVAAPASAKPDPSKGNSQRSQATPVALDAGDIGFTTCDDGAVEFYTIDHGFEEADGYTWREPARLGGGNYVSDGGPTYGTLYLGVSGPECGEVHHKGQVSVYYEVDGELYSIIAQFNGKGELIRVNGVRPNF